MAITEQEYKEFLINIPEQLLKHKPRFVLTESKNYIDTHHNIDTRKLKSFIIEELQKKKIQLTAGDFIVPGALSLMSVALFVGLSYYFTAVLLSWPCGVIFAICAAASILIIYYSPLETLWKNNKIDTVIKQINDKDPTNNPVMVVDANTEDREDAEAREDAEGNLAP